MQLHPLSFLHQSISPPTPAAPRAAGQREEPLPFSLPVLHVPMCSLPRNLLTKHHPLLRLDCRAIFAAWILFLTSGLPFLLSGFPPSWQPISGSACLLCFCGELSGPLQWECPGSENPRREISRLCFETDFLVPQLGTSCQLTLCVCGFFPVENPRQFTVLAYSCPFLACDTGAQKKLLSFHLINTRTGENVTGSHRRKTPCGEAVERRLLDARNLFPAGAAEVALLQLLLQLFRAAAAPDFLRIGKASWSQWWQRCSRAPPVLEWKVHLCRSSRVALLLPSNYSKRCQLGRNIQIRTLLE